MSDPEKNWQEIARKLAKESDPTKRRRIQRDLRRALERAGFQNFTSAMQGETNRADKDYDEE